MDIDVKHIDDLIEWEFNRISDIMIQKKELSLKNIRSYKVITKINNLIYITKSIFLFRQEFNYGYIISFTATKGTYEKNLKIFDEFLKNIEFTNPKLKMTFFREK